LQDSWGRSYSRTGQKTKVIDENHREADIEAEMFERPEPAKSGHRMGSASRLVTASPDWQPDLNMVDMSANGERYVTSIR
jgi:hypothetical protein